jgi:5-methylcytosine-specific restriction protein B
MGLDDLTADEIIEIIKEKKHKYGKGGYLYVDGIKLSPRKTFEEICDLKKLNIQDTYTTSHSSNPNLNIYTKLLSILDKLNNEQIYLKITESYKMDKRYKEKYEAQLKYLPETQQSNSKEILLKQYPLNQILYGSPGTGKTYNTINKALEIIDGEVPEKRTDARDRFEELRESGQIEFVTFHQSYGYEEFIEGIKADINSDEIHYILEDGIFKKIANKATLLQRTYHIEDIDFSQYLTVGQKFKTMRGLEFEIIEVGNKIKIKSPKERDISIGRDKILDYLEVQDFTNTRKHYSYQPVVAKYIFDQLNQNNLEDNTNKNYILIIDEINRGNISKIFGELITLIEPSKRLGAEEELKLTLPNSKESFGVPSNLYIIGTMNTADRSIAQIDTALRRRFEFVEMMPKPELLDGVVIDDIKVSEVLKAINERIEYIYDREHTIGHSYFMPLINEPTKEKLDEIFRVNIIPLLAEYFYGDWEDIRFVLNNEFVKEKKPSKYIKNRARELNRVYEINESFELNEYLKIYVTDNN